MVLFSYLRFVTLAIILIAPTFLAQVPKAKLSAPRRLTFAEARQLLRGEAEGNLGGRPGVFTTTRLQNGKVLELYYPVVSNSSKKLQIAAPGYGLLYESEADYQESKRPRHMLEDLIPDGQAFIDSIPQLVARLQKRLRVGPQALDYSRASLKRIDLYVASHRRTHTTADTDPQLFQELTAYYGETLRRALNAEWRISRERINQTLAYSVPNLVFEANGSTTTGEIKPWSSIISALYDEDKRGSKISAIFEADLAAARGVGTQKAR